MSFETHHLETLMDIRMNGTKLRDMNTCLQDTGAVIAGSSLIQSIIGTDWENIDMDIWLPTNEQQTARLAQISHLLRKSGYTDETQQIITTPSQYSRLAKFIRTIVTFHGGARRIPVQVMMLNKDIAVADLVRSFDITATQFLYDGRTILQIGGDSYDHLVRREILFSVEACSSQSHMEWLRTLNRVKKYRNRGFSGPSRRSWELVTRSIYNHLIHYWNETSPAMLHHESNLEVFQSEWNASIGEKDTGTCPVLTITTAVRYKPLRTEVTFDFTDTSTFVLVTDNQTTVMTGDFQGYVT